MTGLALWLSLVGLLDLARVRDDRSDRRFLLLLTSVGVVATVAVALLVRPSGGGWIAWLIAVPAGAGWILGSGRASVDAAGGSSRRASGATARAAALGYASLGAGLLAFGLAGAAAGSAPALERVLAGSVLAGLPPERVLTLAALLVVQIATVNVVVRLLLDLVGVPASDNEKTLRGGRVLGPMERLLIVGLGTAGSINGAIVVVAAKALLRFPELRVPRAGDPGYGGPSDVTEYFLVGSFASWLVALGSVGLTAIAS